MKKLTLIIVAISLFIFISQAKTILFIGDSITDGHWGSPQKYPCSSEERNLTDLNHILGHGFAEMTAGYYMGTFPTSDFYFINRGISGETLPMIAGRWDKDAMAHNPDIISLLFGANDIHNWLKLHPEKVEEFDFDGYKFTVDSLINVTRKRFPDCQIVLCSPFAAEVGKIAQTGDFALRTETNMKMGEMLNDIANNNQEVYYVDFFSLLNKLQKENGEMSYWMWDGIHPTTAMHYRMSQEWIEKMDSILR